MQHAESQQARRVAVSAGTTQTRTEQTPVPNTKPARVLDHLRKHVLSSAVHGDPVAEKFLLDGPDEL
jgi:hypothetical protein